MKIDLEQIRELLSVVSATDVTELTIEFGDQRITVKKEPPTVVQSDISHRPIAMKTALQAAELAETTKMFPVTQDAAAAKVASTPLAVAPETPAPASDNGNGAYVEITSPMVGTFYRASSPGKPPYVDIGDQVKVGDTVCIIEAMKLMNDMPTEVAGKIVRVLVENGTTVEYGQALFLVDPRG